MMKTQNGRIGPFVIKGIVGQGSFATVYSAIHEDTHRLVAIKAIDKVRFAENIGYANKSQEDHISRNQMRTNEVINENFDHKYCCETNEIQADIKNGTANSDSGNINNTSFSYNLNKNCKNCKNAFQNNVNDNNTIPSYQNNGNSSSQNFEISDYDSRNNNHHINTNNNSNITNTKDNELKFDNSTHNKSVRFEEDIKKSTEKNDNNNNNISHKNDSEKLFEQFRKEADIMKSLDHPNIVPLYQVIEDERRICFVMEYIDNCSLLDYVNSQGPLPENKAKKIFFQILLAIEYLHNVVNVLHRDIKAENILLDQYLNVRLIDFGLSKEMPAFNKLLTTACGSTAYASPELIRGQPYSMPADLWSLGIVLYAITVGCLPFRDNNFQRSADLILKTEPHFPSKMSASLSDLIHKLLIKDPTNRITIEEIKQHPWVMSMDSSCYYSNDDAYKNRKDQFFIFDEETNIIDETIVDNMNQMKINTDNLLNDLKTKNMSDVSMTYKILKREKINENLDKFYKIRLAGEKLPRLKNEKSTPSLNITNILLLNSHGSPASKSMPSDNNVKSIFGLQNNSKPLGMKTSALMCLPRIRRRAMTMTFDIEIDT